MASNSSEDKEVISKEFLENALGRKIKSFSIKQKADTGDNFMSILFNLDVIASNEKGNTETLHLISKCYPRNAGRQAFLNSTGMFWKELDFYKKWIPELLKIIQDSGLEETIKLNFPTLVAGAAESSDKGSRGNGKTNAQELKGTFENYVMMVDLCKTYGFKLGDRHVRLDKDHLLLAVEALAKFHALGWAYKTRNKIDIIKEKFPSMVYEYDHPMVRMTYEGVMSTTIDEAVESLRPNPETNPKALDGLINFKNTPCNKVMRALFGESDEPEEEIVKYFRVKPKEVPESTVVPWRVVIHGDCQVTNMLFRYNSETNKPEEMFFVDLQMSREACPLIDLVYFMYTSTYYETRQKHSDEILEFYYEKFNYFCKIFQTETLPGFTLKELKRRYQRSKIFGFLIALMIAPIMLKEKEDAVELDAVKGTQTEIVEKVAKGIGSSERIKKNIRLLIQEFYDEGII